MVASALRKLFQDTSLEELCSQQQICILKDTATVEQALKVGTSMFQHSLHSLAQWVGAHPAVVHTCMLVSTTGWQPAHSLCWVWVTGPDCAAFREATAAAA